jgi:hypothetical protein
VSVELFRRRADECRHLAAAATNASDKAFWLGLVERWETLEVQKARGRPCELNRDHRSGDNLNSRRSIDRNLHEIALAMLPIPPKHQT